MVQSKWPGFSNIMGFLCISVVLQFSFIGSINTSNLARQLAAKIVSEIIHIAYLLWLSKIEMLNHTIHMSTGDANLQIV